ncbi:MAG: chromosome segregation protein SMC [Coriobacteriia bacterium]|nr:chromosome segregation protein SMC [Coriobacteriia bacterium]
MHLRSLILKGFKSFADRTVLSLEPGVTVVVGPNGSGKSNIADAVLWVLGEQSAKSLRGQAMEDVIFAGSSARQPVGVAEVDLVLDNSDGTLPIEFNEVTITRRMFRSGESEYLVNQSPCRLMDVHELLHDSGLGRDTHSIISQGRLDEVLNSRPEDRRALIEEAAGVLKHKKRRERALRKLSSMDAHLERARDISAEIDRQLRPLQRQASRAAQHAEIREELVAVETALAVDDLRALQHTWDELGKREKEQAAEIELTRYRLAEKERELATFQALLEEKGLFVGDLSEQRRRLQSVLERINSGLLLLEEKGKNLIERLSELRAKLYHAQTRSESRSIELERLTEERAETDTRLKVLYGQLGELRRETETTKKERIAADKALAHITAEIRRGRKNTDDLRMEVSILEQSLSAYRLEVDLLAERLTTLREHRATVASTLSSRRTRLEQLDADLTRARKLRALADSDVDKRVRVLDTRRKELAEVRERLTSARAGVHALGEVDRAFESASPALAWALSRQRDLPGFVGPLAERIRVPTEYERLLEHLLGTDLFAVLVDDVDAAARIAQSAAEESEGELALIPLEGPRTPSRTLASTGTPLIDLVESDPSLRPALAALLGDVFVVDSLPEAVRALRADTTGARFATPAGAIAWPGGKVTVGRVVATDGAGVLTRKRRITELEDEAAALDIAVGEAEATASSAEEAVFAAQQDALELGQKIAQLAGEHDSLREEIGRLEQALTSHDAEAVIIESRREEIEARIAKDAPGIDTIKSDIVAAEAGLEDFEERAARAREQRDSRFRDEVAINERLSACQVDIATVSEREVHLKRQISAITSELAELANTVTQSRETETALELLRERIEPVHDLYAALLECAEHWAARLKDRAHFEQADSESLRSTIHEAQDAVRELQSVIDSQSSVMSDIRVDKGQLEVQVSTAVARIVEEYGVPLERALEHDPLDNRHSAEDRAHSLRKSLENMGPVNPVAMQEFEALKARRDFMNDQIEDLVGSRQALQKVVAAIDRKIRDRFLETFEQVNNHFQEVFTVLFPGGHSSLELTEPDDPEATGVEVIAQPRGKKLSKMSLMSGGEKSLTALALLFAVYRTRPCPFYILDEVEAALDDTNLRRFIAFADTMRAHTQFVIVTHQRRTMEMADVLYGVSMQADGVSKVVSQKLERGVVEEAADGHALV